MSFSNDQLRDFSSLFTRSEVRRWQKNDFESIRIKLDRYNLSQVNKGRSFLAILKKAYKTLERHYPNEYVIKNEFLNQWLRTELGGQNAKIFNEFRIGKAIADLAMFNGISKVFEIKTILDKDYRLSNQLQEYKKVFNEVYIIIPSTQIFKYLSTNQTTGIISYDSKSKKFELVRKAVTNFEIDGASIMNVLHTKEYIKIVSEYYKEIPTINAFNQFDICKELIKEIPSEELNTLFVNTMKERSVNNLFFQKGNIEFNQICLCLNLKQKERDNLIDNLKINFV